jgi:YVTN family beta-propeller protein
VSVIASASNTVTATIPVGGDSRGVVVTPDGSTAYVAGTSTNTVSMIDTASNAVTATIPLPVGATAPFGVAVTPDGSKVYVTNLAGTSVSVIDTATNTVIGSPIVVGTQPVAFGTFIQPAPKFAGTPGKVGCIVKSDAILIEDYKGLNNAATLGYTSIPALEKAILVYCWGV